MYCDCVCNRPLVRYICPDYELVVFQPWTVTPPHLGSVYFCYTFKLGLLPHLFLQFPRLLFSWLFTTASPSVAVHRQRPLFYGNSKTVLVGSNLFLSIVTNIKNKWTIWDIYWVTFSFYIWCRTESWYFRYVCVIWWIDTFGITVYGGFNERRWRVM